MTISNLINAKSCLGVIAGGSMLLLGAIATPAPANAFGITDVFGAIEDVVEFTEDKIGDAGRAVGKRVRKIGRGTITSTRPSGGRQVTGRPTNSGNTAAPPSRRRATSSALPPAGGVAKPTGDRGLPPPRRTSQRPRPITEGDVRPPVISCNSKFENCSNGHHWDKGHKKKSKATHERRKHRAENTRKVRSSKKRNFKKRSSNRRHSRRNG
ncbi:MAG: hypothetical protein ACR2O0_15065 [Rhizobiaceae bacterium]